MIKWSNFDNHRHRDTFQKWTVYCFGNMWWSWIHLSVLNLNSNVLRCFDCFCSGCQWCVFSAGLHKLSRQLVVDRLTCKTRVLFSASRLFQMTANYFQEKRFSHRTWTETSKRFEVPSIDKKSQSSLCWRGHNGCSENWCLTSWIGYKGQRCLAISVAKLLVYLKLFEKIVFTKLGKV